MASIVSGKNVVVTGTFPGKLRPAVEQSLRDLGANVQKAVGSTTDYLFCGAKVGERKTRAAESFGVKMLNLDDYKAIMRGDDTRAEEPVVIKPKMTHEEYIASIPENYGGW
jgi:DNA ligase (NAD+)